MDIEQTATDDESMMAVEPAPIKLALTVKEMAQALTMSERSVWRLAATGEIPAPFRVGRSVRWRRATVELWLQKQERAALRQQQAEMPSFH